MRQLQLYCEGTQRMNGLTSIVVSQGSWFWKEAGCRKDYSTLVGRMKVNANHVRRRKAQKKHRLYHCPKWYEVRRGIPEAFRKWEQKSEDFKDGVVMTKRYCFASSQ